MAAHYKKLIELFIYAVKKKTKRSKMLLTMALGKNLRLFP